MRDWRIPSKMERFGKIKLTIFATNPVLNLWEGSAYVSGFKYVRVLNIRRFLLIWQGSEYALGSNYGSAPNIPGFRVCQAYGNASVAQSSEYVRIWLNNALWQGSEYVWLTFHRVLNKPPVLNMPGLSIWLGCEYVRVTQGAEYVWVSLSLP